MVDLKLTYTLKSILNNESKITDTVNFVDEWVLNNKGSRRKFINNACRQLFLPEEEEELKLYVGY